MRNARDYAIVAHGTQMYGEYHYSKHLDDVYDICQKILNKCVENSFYYINFSYNNYYQVCYLHDILEDTNITYNELCKDFNEEIAFIVYMISSNKPFENRKQKINFMYKMFNEVYQNDRKKFLAKLVKSCDRLANMRSCSENNNLHLLNMYVKEYKDFKNTFYVEEFKELYDEMEAIINA